MAHVTRAVARHDALVGQHGGGERLFARPGAAARHHVQRGRPRRRACLPQLLPCLLQRLLHPRRGDRLDLHVRFAEGSETAAAQLSQASVELAADRAELRVARIAQAQHGELQRRQLRRALAADELEQAARVVRRFAVALGADHQQQVAFLRQLALRVGIGAQQPHRQAGRFATAGQLLGDALRIAGLAAVDDRQPTGRLPRRRGSHPATALHLLGLRRAPRGDPVQLGGSQAFQFPGQPGKLVRIEAWRWKVWHGDGIHTDSIWTSILLDVQIIF